MRYPLVIPGRMHATRRMIEAAAAEQGVRLRIELEVDAVISILDLVSEGIGYAVLPLNATTSDALKRRFQDSSDVHASSICRPLSLKAPTTAESW